jgi:ferrochelatase
MLRRTVAWLIATIRQRKSRGLYRQIGGGSPLGKITEAQAAALEERLAAIGCRARVYVGMRCWKPTIDEAVEQIAADGIKRLVALPLFPQFSVTTTGSCRNYFRTIAQKSGLSSRIEIHYLDAWFEEPLYLEAMADLIREAQGRFSNQTAAGIHLLYSAHSIPERYVQEGDPYLEQTQKTVALINERLGGLFPFTLAFQSKVGPVKWLGPPTMDVLAQLGERGVDKVLAVPISFVSDHIETLQEIDILYRDMARKAGIQEFHRARSLNVYPKFIEALAGITLAALAKTGGETG